MFSGKKELCLSPRFKSLDYIAVNKEYKTESSLEWLWTDVKRIIQVNVLFKTVRQNEFVAIATKTD